MDEIHKILSSISNSHSKSFISKYGGDLFISILIIYIFLTAISYFYVLANIPKLRSEWDTKKCNPLYMPFAALVLNKSDKSSLNILQDNFSGCINNILHSIAQDSLAPLYYTRQLALDSANQSLNAVNSIRAFFNKIRNDISHIVENIMGRSLNVMIPPMQMAISTKDSLSKIKGVYATGVYFMITTYMLIQVVFKIIINFIVFGILATLVASIIGLMAIPFVGQGLAAPLIAISIAISIPTAMIIANFNNMFKTNISLNFPSW